MTGMYQTTIGAHNHRSHRDDGYQLPEGVRVVSDWLRDAGYFTANVDLYRRAVVSMFTEFLRDLPGSIPAMKSADRAESVAMSQPTSGHSKLSNQDIHDIMMLQIPLTVDWGELNAARDRELAEREAEAG